MPDDMILSMDDFPELTSDNSPEGLPGEPIPSASYIPPKMPPLESHEIEDKPVTITVTANEAPEASETPEAPENVPPLALPREIPLDELPEPIVVPSEKV